MEYLTLGQAIDLMTDNHVMIKVEEGERAVFKRGSSKPESVKIGSVFVYGMSGFLECLNTGKKVCIINSDKGKDKFLLMPKDVYKEIKAAYI